jgi:hypothetical protein
MSAAPHAARQGQNHRRCGERARLARTKFQPPIRKRTRWLMSFSLREKGPVRIWVSAGKVVADSRAAISSKSSTASQGYELR